MRLSRLTTIPTSSQIIDAFGGYDHNLRIASGKLYDMENLVSDYYPVLSCRKKRGTYPAETNDGTHHFNGMIAKDALCYVDGTDLYINRYKITGFTLTDTPKQLVSMGAYIVILPDKKYINTLDYTDKGSIEAEYATSGQTVTYELCKQDGEVYSDVTVSSTEPTSPVNNQLWIDTSTTPHVLKQYSAQNAVWTEITTTYVKIKAPGIGTSFAAYDAVSINGISSSITELQELNGQISTLWAVRHDATTPANDFIVVTGFLTATATQVAVLTVKRQMPELDFVIESGNRLWGCRYGTDNNGNVVNEIYASKLGDFKNWNSFQGISTDSYVASCGTDGQFTGAISHLGYPLFFKENCLHKVYGNYPANYQIQSTPCRGVQKGCGKSLAIVNSVLYYKSRNGVCVYDGSLPAEISSVFGDERFSALDNTTGADPLRNGAVGGACRNKYYLSAKSETDDQWHLLVYDTTCGMWHKEDKTRVDEFCSCRNEMYYIDHDKQLIKTIFGSGTPDTNHVTWMAESGIIGMSVNNKKYLTRILVNMALEVGARAHFFIEYNSSGDFTHVATFTGKTLRSFNANIRPKRCDHFRIRITGAGDVKIYSLTQIFEKGSYL